MALLFEICFFLYFLKLSAGKGFRTLPLDYLVCPSGFCGLMRRTVQLSSTPERPQNGVKSDVEHFMPAKFGKGVDPGWMGGHAPPHFLDWGDGYLIVSPPPAHFFLCLMKFCFFIM